MMMVISCDESHDSQRSDDRRRFACGDVFGTKMTPPLEDFQKTSNSAKGGFPKGDDGPNQDLMLYDRRQSGRRRHGTPVS